MRSTQVEGGTKGERTRAALTGAAVRILCDHGYQALSIAALAEDAGIQRHSFYTHFRGLGEIVDRLSLGVLDKIGSQTRATDGSVLLSRLAFVLSLAEDDPPTAAVLSELYRNHAATADEVHRRVTSDLRSDRRRGLTSMTARESEMAAIVVSAGAMELLAGRRRRRRKDDELFVNAAARLCGIAR